MTKIGIMGGTFNPIHLAHLQMAREAVIQEELDQVLFMPSKNPPHKRGENILSGEHRAAMVRLAVEGEDRFIFSDYELRREGITYTAETLEQLQKQFPLNRYYFIMGGDSFFQLESWYQPQEIMERAVILALNRDGIQQEKMEQQAEKLRTLYQAAVRIIRMEPMDISSSIIRDRISRGLAIEGLVPPEVEHYIRENQLYC